MRYTKIVFPAAIMTAVLSAGSVLAQAKQPAPGGGLTSFLPMMILMFIIIYFLMFRPEQKKQKERRAMIDNLKKGDKILTAGGILGVVGNVKDNLVMVKIAENTVVEITKSAITSVVSDTEQVEDKSSKDSREKK